MVNLPGPSSPAGSRTIFTRAALFLLDNAVALILGYFLLQTLLRGMLPISLNRDESEQAILVQVLDWGYGPQPPLYTWLQWLAFQILGETTFAFALVKNGLIASTFLLVRATALRAGAGRRTANLAMLTLMLLPQVAWESQRALSHTVLAVTLGAATLHRLVVLVEERRTRDFLLLGLLFGLGILGKYNFPLMPLAAIAAAASLPALRPAVLDWRMLVALLIAAVIVTPHALWVSGHLDAATASLDKFGLGQGNRLAARLKGTAAYGLAVLLFLAPLLIAYGLVLAHRWRQSRAGFAPQGQSHLVTMLWRALLFSALAGLLVVLAGGATEVKDRWLQPLLFFAPLVLALRQSMDEVQAGGGLSPGHSALPVLSALSMAAVLVALPAYGLTRQPSVAIFQRLALEIERQVLGTRTIVAELGLVAGNLRWHMPGVAALYPNFAQLPVRMDRPVVVIWREESPSPPHALADLLGQRVGPGSLAAVGALQSPMWRKTMDTDGLAFAPWQAPVSVEGRP